MTTLPAQDTMRTKVLDALAARFPQRGTPEGDDFETQYGVVFSLVTREPLGALPQGKWSSLGFYGATTERTVLMPHYQVLMPVTAEVHVQKEPEIEIAKTAERYMGVVEQRLREDPSLGGIVARLEFRGDTVNIDSPYPNQADGALYFDMAYFQHMDIPTRGR
jgi:hypothetical protein